jgi:type III secretion protein V
MSAGEAAHTYSLLSIGAGLVAQIPSLLVAVASGLLVTRVASSGDRALGADLGAQLVPRALAGVAILLVGLALVPGLPIGPFLVLGVLAAGGALVAARSRGTAVEISEPGASRVTLRLAPALYDRLAARPAELHAALAAARADLPHVPPLGVARDASLNTNELAIALDQTPVAWLTLDGEPLDALRRRLPASLAPLAPELLGVDRVAALVERAAVTSPVLVREVVPRMIALPVLADVLRQLAREGVPIDDLTAVLESIALAPQPLGEVPALVEQLRGQLRRQITARWAPRGQIAVYTLDGMIEDAVRSSLDRRDGVLALEPAIAQDIVAAVRTKLGTGPGVLLVSGDVRRHLRGLLEAELPEVAILAAHELAPGTAVTTAGRVDVG